jgi:hypothetical protein
MTEAFKAAAQTVMRRAIARLSRRRTPRAMEAKAEAKLRLRTTPR